MPDFGPGARIKPKALITQLDPETSEIIECGLRYDVELPSGIVIHDREHWWHEATPLQRAQAKLVAHKAVRAIAGRHDLEHRPSPPKEGEA